MRNLFLTFAALGALAIGLNAPGATATEATISGVGGGNFSVATKSITERRWQTVVRQKYDYSCGSAAVATLLTYHYGLPASEAEIYTVMYQAGDKRRIRQLGFSMLDMKRYLESNGFRADGFRLGLDEIRRISVPVITLINTGGYMHFVVVKTITDAHVMVGDPARGVSLMPRGEFEEIWSGKVLAIRNESGTGRNNWDHARDWDRVPKAPVGDGVDRNSLGFRQLNLPQSNEFF